jgi:chromosome segregation ATPase
MTAPVTPPPGRPPYDALPPDAPATVEDVRASRRWTWVALAWAVAASIIAVIALVQNNNNDTSGTSTQQTQSAQDLQASIQQFEKQTNDRLDAFSRRLNETAAKSDVDKLDKRLSQVEDDLSQTKSDVSKQSSSIQQLQSDVKDLQQRVNDLESKQQNSGTTTTP